MPQLIFFKFLELSETSRATKLIFGLHVNIDNADNRRCDVPQSAHQCTVYIPRSQIRLQCDIYAGFGSVAIYNYCIEELLKKSHTKLFRRLTNPAHFLHPILPSYNKSHKFFSEKRGHTFILPHCTYNLYKTLFSPVVFLGSYNFCDVVFYIICHDVLYQFLCIAHVW